MPSFKGFVRSLSIRKPKKGQDKTEINTLNENIGTYDTSNFQTEASSSDTVCDTVSSSISSSTDQIVWYNGPNQGVNHPEDSLGTNINPVIRVSSQENNDLELTKQKLVEEKEERRVERNQLNRRIAELEQQNAEERQLRKRVERQRDLQAQRATDAETREAQLRIRLQARHPIDDMEPQQPPDHHQIHSSGYNTFDSRGAPARSSSRQVKKKYSENQ